MLKMYPGLAIPSFQAATSGSGFCNPCGTEKVAMPPPYKYSVNVPQLGIRPPSIDETVPGSKKYYQSAAGFKVGGTLRAFKVGGTLRMVFFKVGGTLRAFKVGGTLRVAFFEVGGTLRVAFLFDV